MQNSDLTQLYELARGELGSANTPADVEIAWMRSAGNTNYHRAEGWRFERDARGVFATHPGTDHKQRFSAGDYGVVLERLADLLDAVVKARAKTRERSVARQKLLLDGVIAFRDERYEDAISALRDASAHPCEPAEQASLNAVD